MRRAACYALRTSTLCSRRGVSCGLCRVRVCVPFSCAGMECAHCLRERSGAKSPPLAPIPKGETVCTSHAPDLCRPPRASIARGPELNSLPSDHYEPTLSLVTLWVKKRPLSCRPLRVRSLLVGSTVRHVAHSLCQVERLCLLPYDGVHKGFLGGFRSSINLDERSPSSKSFHPVGRLPFVGCSCQGIPQRIPFIHSFG